MNNTEVGNNPNDKASGEEYFDRRGQQQEAEEFRQSPFVDRSAQLRATMNSLAALNAANVVRRAKDKYKKVEENKKTKQEQKVQEIENQEEKEKTEE